MKLSALTCSTGRPEALALCKLYVQRQADPVFEHVVAEGGTFWQNLFDGIKRVSGDAVVLFEDDDWYPSDWTIHCEEGLTRALLFGQDRVFNYHVPSGGYEEVVDSKHSPLHATAFASSLIPLLMSICELGLSGPDAKPSLDRALWSMPVRKLRSHHAHVISMKGMPGKVGYSVAHRKDHYRTFDADRSILFEKIGEDRALYADWFDA